jgi:diguanylate cyclase (GGDEF)-like protein
MHDVTERREQSERLLHDATHDRLTGLANRARFAEAIDLTIRRAYRANTTFAVLFLDLDQFKPINDMSGHDAGDEVLREVARRLTGCLRPADTPARLGGDEFVVVLDPPVNADQAERIARRIIAAVSQPIEVPGGTAQIGVSIGIAIAHGAGMSSDAVVRDADLAMYQAEEAGRNRYHTCLSPAGTVLEPHG